MPNKVTTICLPPLVLKKGHIGAIEVFGKGKNFSTYLAMLINDDFKKRKLKLDEEKGSIENTTSR